MGGINGPKLKRLLWLSFFFFVLNLLLIIVISSLYIGQKGVLGVVAIGGARFDEKELDDKVSVGEKSDLNNAKDKLEEFAESEIESLEMILSEDEINVLLQDWIKQSRIEEREDAPSKEILEQSGLEDFTQTLSGGFIDVNNLELMIDLLDEKMKIYASLNSGANWFVITTEPIEVGNSLWTLKIKSVESRYPSFLNNWIADQLNKGVEDAFIDFDEKNIGGRRINSIKVEEGELILVGNVTTSENHP